MVESTGVSDLNSSYVWFSENFWEKLSFAFQKIFPVALMKMKGMPDFSSFSLSLSWSKGWWRTWWHASHSPQSSSSRRPQQSTFWRSLQQKTSTTDTQPSKNNNCSPHTHPTPHTHTQQNDECYIWMRKYIFSQILHRPWPTGQSIIPPQIISLYIKSTLRIRPLQERASEKWREWHL